jgi:type II secretory pathway component PulF
MGRYFGGALAGTIFGSLFDVAFAQFHLHLPASAALLLASQRLFESIVLLAVIAGVICGFLFWYSHLDAKVQKGVFPG